MMPQVVTTVARDGERAEMESDRRRFSISSRSRTIQDRR